MDTPPWDPGPIAWLLGPLSALPWKSTSSRVDLQMQFEWSFSNPALATRIQALSKMSSLTFYPLSKDSPFPQHLLWTTMYSFGFLHHIFCVYTTPSSSPLCHQVDVRLWSFNDCTEHKNEKRCLYQGYRVAFFYISNSIHCHRNWTLEPKYRERRLVNHKWEKVHQIKHVSQRGSGTILSLQLGLLDLQWKRSNGLHPCTFLCISEHCPSPSYPTPPPTPL